MTIKQNAFTLIELLVVVAVIAILAAIAVPNFLEAQTRAKVSRVKADLQTIVTGVEMYRVDNNNYPNYHYGDTALKFHMGGVVTGFGVQDTSYDGANPITTPISYISSFPQDPFAKTFERNYPEQWEYQYVNWSYAIEKATPPTRPAFDIGLREYGPYRLHSIGPDTEGPDSGIPYDPSNGTVSGGDVSYGPRNQYNAVVNFP
jgi:type II secretion system protein G